MSDDEPITPDDLTARLGDMLAEQGMAAAERPDCIALGDGLQVKVVAVRADQSAEGASVWSFGVHIGIKCFALFDETIFEFSYGGGATTLEAADDALRRWAIYDLPALREAAAGIVEKCVRVDLGAASGGWQAYLGPLSYVAGARGAQPCCETCLFAMCFEALRPQMTTPVSCAIKIVAIKNEDGTTTADCRRDGDDLPDAIAAIAKAAEAWPPLPGIQMRRQYVILKAPVGRA